MKKDKNKIKPGEVLLVAEPFVATLSSKFRTERCDYCFQPSQLLKCSACQYVYYCNNDCQRYAWKEHKGECKNLKRIQPRVVPDAARTMAKLIIKLNSASGSMEKGYYSKSSYRMFKDLMSHYPDVKKDKVRMEHFATLCAVLNDFLGPDVLPNPVEMLGIYGRLCVNGFNICDPDMTSIGVGIYLAPTIIDHSCDPNAVAVFEQRTISIRAIKELSAPLDWDKVFISYIDLMSDTNERQQELLSTYYFLCQCSRCTNDQERSLMKSMLCPNPECGEPIFVNDIKDGDDNVVDLSCSKCEAIVKDETFKEFKEVSDFTDMHLKTMKDVAYLDVCNLCLRKQAGLFHPMNIQHLKTLDAAYQSAIQMNQFETALRYGKQLIPGFREYFGQYHPSYAILLLMLAKILVYVENFKEAAVYLKESEKIIEITHGKQHTLYRQDFLPLLFQTQAALGKI
ncbi:hypothetical protein LSTR_LSTR005470 [Laodelphax striatellus]|uniref:MYND-type domain-containing protein n=1 Tax=Laodelphax striatellus TaxID=195883 RepID=A0A482WY48_LAOST|nr:hypothetical protein LSTR_LSTR005470 [Laodelphax striatellus]